MDEITLKQLVVEIVKKANNLKNKHTSEKNAKVNYACIFAQSSEQYNTLLTAAKEIGGVIKETPTGPLYHIQPINTVAGNLKLLKIRKPDATRPELGDADFTVENYPEFKKKHLTKTGFKLIPRENFEMIELIDPKFDVRAYFSNPPLDKQLGLCDSPISQNQKIIIKCAKLLAFIMGWMLPFLTVIFFFVMLGTREPASIHMWFLIFSLFYILIITVSDFIGTYLIGLSFIAYFCLATITGFFLVNLSLATDYELYKFMRYVISFFFVILVIDAGVNITYNYYKNKKIEENTLKNLKIIKWIFNIMIYCFYAYFWIALKF